MDEQEREDFIKKIGISAGDSDDKDDEEDEDDPEHHKYNCKKCQVSPTPGWPNIITLSMWSHMNSDGPFARVHRCRLPRAENT